MLRRRRSVWLVLGALVLAPMGLSTAVAAGQEPDPAPVQSTPQPDAPPGTATPRVAPTPDIPVPSAPSVPAARETAPAAPASSSGDETTEPATPGGSPAGAERGAGRRAAARRAAARRARAAERRTTAQVRDEVRAAIVDARRDTERPPAPASPSVPARDPAGALAPLALALTLTPAR
jgi:hypothetical protein